MLRGTYIRTIAHRLGEMVGCPANLSSLRRTVSGEYTIKDAVDFLSLAETSEHNHLERLVRPFPFKEMMT